MPTFELLRQPIGVFDGRCCRLMCDASAALQDAGFQDLQAVRSDPDLASLHGRELEALLARRGSPLAKLAGGLFGGFGRK